MSEPRYPRHNIVLRLSGGPPRRRVKTRRMIKPARTKRTAKKERASPTYLRLCRLSRRGAARQRLAAHPKGKIFRPYILAAQQPRRQPANRTRDPHPLPPPIAPNYPVVPIRLQNCLLLSIVHRRPIIVLRTQKF